MEKSKDMAKFRREKTSFAEFKEMLENYSVSCDLMVKAGTSGIEYKCHRIILASASELLRNVLETSEPGKLPILILPDVTSEAIKLVLNYVYNGEVKVPFAVHAEFMDVCRFLEIKGVDEPMEVVEVEEENNANYDKDDDKSASEIEDVSFDEETFEIKIKTTGISNEITEKRVQKLCSATKMKVEDSNLENDFDSSEVSDDFSDDEDAFDRNKNKFSKISVKSVSENYEEKRAKECIRRIYDIIDKKPKKPLDEVLKSLKLVYGNQKLANVTHNCGFCDRPVSTHYRSNRYYFDATHFKEHLTKVHKIKVPSMRKRAKNEIFKRTQVTKINHEKRLKKHIRGIYDRLDKKPIDDLESVVSKTKLFIKGTLLNAEHSCGFCGKIFKSNYQKCKEGIKQWISTKFRNHLKVDHEVNFIKYE